MTHKKGRQNTVAPSTGDYSLPSGVFPYAGGNSTHILEQIYIGNLSLCRHRFIQVPVMRFSAAFYEQRKIF